MTWLRLDDGFGEHPKIDALSDGAYRLHVQGMNYSARMLTGGIIAASRVDRLMPKFKRSYTAELVNAGVWEAKGDGWLIHDFLDYNPTKETVQKRRDARAAAGKKGGKKKAQALAKARANDEQNGSATSDLVPTPTRPDRAGVGECLSVGEPPPALASHGGAGSDAGDDAAKKAVASARQALAGKR